MISNENQINQEKLLNAIETSLNFKIVTEALCYNLN
jgi:hypothetical protein